MERNQVFFEVLVLQKIIKYNDQDYLGLLKPFTRIDNCLVAVNVHDGP
jgi:hypothetical protein